MRLFLLLLTFTLPFLTLTPPALAADGQPYWADVADIAQYLPKFSTDATVIQAAVQSDSRFRTGLASFAFGLHLEYAPTLNADGSSTYRAAALMKGPLGNFFYRKFAVTLGGHPRSVTVVSPQGDIPLSSMHFTISAGLIDRMVVVEDVKDNVLLVFPLAVGGLDENVMGQGRRILTPQFHGAWIDRTTVIPKMTDPAYYRGLPLMPITNKNGVETGIAFHITLLSDADWQNLGPNFLPRTFESHGCMRMRERDLEEFFTVVMSSADQKLPVNVDYFVWNRNSQGVRDQTQGQVTDIHPYPFTDGSFMSVIDFPSQNPPYIIDSDGLVEMGQVNGAADLRDLSDFTADDATDLSSFQGLEAGLGRYRLAP